MYYICDTNSISFIVKTENLTEIIKNRLFYGDKFLFVDEITDVDEDHISGCYTFRGDEFFYTSHFIGNPVIPGVILVEMMGQIGMVAHAAWFIYKSGNDKPFYPLLSNLTADFFHQVHINEKMVVRATKKYYRKNLLRSNVELINPKGIVVARVEALLTIIIKE